MKTYDFIKASQNTKYRGMLPFRRKRKKCGLVPFSAETQIEGFQDKDESEDYDETLKRRRVGYNSHREIILTQAEVLKEFIPTKPF